MDYRTITWDREKLYDAVWEKPAVQLAKEYGISDVAIAKICKKLNIPKPGLGYWRRKQLGFKVTRKPLPPHKGSTAAVSHVPIQKMGEREPIPKEFISPLKPARVVKKRHETIRSTARVFEKGHHDQFGRPRPLDWQTPRFDLRVTKSGLPRALAFLDELVKISEANGIRAKSTINERDRQHLFGFDVDGEQIRVRVQESVRGRRRVLTAEERRNHEDYPSVYRRDHGLVYDPQGLLTFEIENYSNAQRSWNDTKKNKLEEYTQEIVFGLRAAAAYAKQRRIELEAERKREAEQQRRRLKHQERIDRLKRNLARWEEAERIRAYLVVVRRKAEAREGPLEEDSLMFRCLAWAERYADSIDPSDGGASADWAEDISFPV